MAYLGIEGMGGKHSKETVTRDTEHKNQDVTNTSHDSTACCLSHRE